MMPGHVLLYKERTNTGDKLLGSHLRPRQNPKEESFIDEFRQKMEEP
jgi:hypothetical protein